MTKLFKLRIVTPDKVFYEGEVKELNTETLEGKREVLPMHAPLIAMLKPTTSKITKDNGEEKSFFTSSGILNVSNNEVTVLCDEAEQTKDVG